MTKNETEKLKYLDVILTAIKKGGDNLLFSELVDIIEDDNKSEIIKTLISGASPFLEKSILFLNEQGYVNIKNPIHKDDYKKVSLTFEGELIQSQGGLYQDAKRSENKEKRQSRFHTWMPIIAGLSLLLSIVAIVRTVDFGKTNGQMEQEKGIVKEKSSSESKVKKNEINSAPTTDKIKKMDTLNQDLKNDSIQNSLI